VSFDGCRNNLSHERDVTFPNGFAAVRARRLVDGCPFVALVFCVEELAGFTGIDALQIEGLRHVSSPPPIGSLARFEAVDQPESTHGAKPTPSLALLFQTQSQRRMILLADRGLPPPEVPRIALRNLRAGRGPSWPAL
jgi:hypothetical protein